MTLHNQKNNMIKQGEIVNQSNKQYVALHNHSHYSALDGYATVKEYIKAAKSLGMQGVGLSDHGTASGLYKFITQVKSAGLTPIPGVEFYVAPENPKGAKVQSPVYYGKGGRKDPQYDLSNGAYTHLTVFAYNNTGLFNLFKLTSLSWKPEHFYFKPRIDTNMLAEYSEGLIVASGCPSSEINRRFLLNQDDKAYEYASRLKSIFKDNFYIEIMNHQMPDDDIERILLPKQIKLAKDLDIKIIATNDSHYAFKDDAEPHERVLALSTKSTMSEPPYYEGGKRFAFSNDNYYIKPYNEMLEAIPEEVAEEALANTLEIMEKCKNIELKYDPHLRPEIEIPEGHSPATYLQELIYEGFKKKRGHQSYEIQKESVERIKREFEVIHSNDFISYFLVVHDYIDYAHKNGIGVGAGRGSVGGSEIAYLLDISNTDPLRFGLLFERFLSPGRGSLYQIGYMTGETEEVAVSARKRLYRANGDDEVVYVHELNPGDTVNFKKDKKVIKEVFVKVPGSAPDIDTDFHTEGREKVIEYCVEKYGEENVANIVTFGTFKARRAFKAMCTIYQVPFGAANKASSFIPSDQGSEATLSEITDPASPRYNEGIDFRRATESPVFDEVVEMAAQLDGRISETGVHPCGVVISNQPLAGIIPTQVRQSDGKLVTQWEYPELEALGLMKMDLLGLDLINTIQQTLDNIRLTNESANNPSMIREVPDMRTVIAEGMDDPETYKTLQEGNTVGIFQLGSSGVRDLLKKAKPQSFMEIANITALYRPGPIQSGAPTQYANRKAGLEEVCYIHKEFKGTEVEEILKETYGLLIFQEQIMLIASEYAGISSYETDKLRKAIGKKKMDVMMEMKPKFVEGCLSKGASKEAIETLWDTIEVFGQYGFNKCAWGETLVSTPDYGKVKLSQLYKRQEENPDEEIRVYSMYENGDIKPHTINKIVKTGRKPLYTIITESGKKIKITKDHRILTTDGYGTVEDGKLRVGKEIIVDNDWTKRLYPETAKKEEKVVSSLNSKARKQLQHKSKKCEGVQLSNGEWCDSVIESLVGEYLISRNLKFEIHKPVTNTARTCSFYTDGLYFEIDGSNRGRKHFEEQYGEIPFVYMTPFNYKDVIDETIMKHHIQSGEKIVEIIPPKESSNGEQFGAETYDIEMKDNGPSNFIAEGMVSHNSHSVSYAINIYQTVFLKTHYPSEFMAALIQQGFGNPDKVRAYIQEAMRMQLRLGPVDINNSQVQMASTGNDPENKYDIVFGFSGVKQVNDMFAEAIVAERNKNGNYTSVANFVKRVSKTYPITAAPLSKLALAGAFDVFGVSRKLVSEKAKMIIDSCSRREDKGASLFDMLGLKSTTTSVAESIEIEGEDFDYNEMIKLEADTIGMFVSGHPADRLGLVANMYNAVDLSKVLREKPSRKTSTILGTITQMKSKTTRAGNKSIAVLIDDGTDIASTYLPRSIVQSIEKGEEINRLVRAAVEGRKLKETKRSQNLLELINDDTIKVIEPIELNEPYAIKVRTREQDGSTKVSVVDIKRLKTAPDGSLPYEVNVPSENLVSRIKNLAIKHRDGKGTYVKLHLKSGSHIMLDTRVKLSLDFIIAMEKIVGKENIITEGL